MSYNNSRILFNSAEKVIPGGVNSPVRAFKSVGGTPLFITKGSGAKLTDVDGNEYIDYVGSWGPHIFGHNSPFINAAILEAVENGVSFGAPTETEVEMAQIVSRLVPSVEMVRMVSSGTEATMSAVRAARGYTGRDKIIKFEGCYHGHADCFLIKAGSGALTFGTPTSPGVPAGVAKDTLIAKYNDAASVEKLIEANKHEIAAIIVEPVGGNMGVVNGNQEFLRSLREMCTAEGIVLIFDEVMTGFRVSRGCAQELYGIVPDLTTFGKIIGGGMPVGAFGGKKEIMSVIAPAGPVYQAGTLSGNPVAMNAGYAVLDYIEKHPEVYTELEEKSSFLADGFAENLKKLNRKYILNRTGSMMCMFFTEDGPVSSFDDAIKSDTKLYAAYFHKMLERGIYLAPSQFEAMFVSTAHTYDMLSETIAAHYKSIKEII
jgi:glutamate-1-semialdehyde 2,1-aminomutase